jgi:hypothetical protein
MKLLALFIAIILFNACNHTSPLNTTNSNQSPPYPQNTATKPVGLVSYKIIKEEVKNDRILNRSIIDTRIVVSGKLTKDGLEQTLRNIMNESRVRNSSKIKHPREVSNFIYAYKTASYLQNPAGWVGRLVFVNTLGDKDVQITIQGKAL